jgi:hypothetical protein
MSFAMCTLKNNILSSRPLELAAGESDRDQQSQIVPTLPPAWMQAQGQAEMLRGIGVFAIGMNSVSTCSDVARAQIVSPLVIRSARRCSHIGSRPGAFCGEHPKRMNQAASSKR